MPDLPSVKICRAYGGIVKTAELLAAGCTQEDIRMTVGYGRLQRIRKGWYGIPELDPEALRAWRVGGRLGCVSALRFHGYPIPFDGRLHVSLLRWDSRLRTPTSSARRLAQHPDPAVVTHWTRTLHTGTRLAVGVERAKAEAAACAHPATL